MKKLLSIILPIYNEEKNIPLLYHELSLVLQQLHNYQYELLFINDGSSDSSQQILLGLAQKDSRVRVINFSRNFGHQIALIAGYDHAQGDVIITMDADLQHPPELIPKMIEAWQGGSYIVYVRNSQRNDSILKKLTAYWYYRLLDYVTDVPIPRHVQDFRLIDKKVAHIIRTSREKSPYLRGLVAWTGFQASFLECQFNQRKQGVSGYTWKKMFSLAFNGITGFSLFPLKIASFMGLFVIITGIGMFGYITFDALLFNVYYPLFKWLVTFIYISIGVLFILIWLIGEYIGRMYQELQARPLYIIEYDSWNTKNLHDTMPLTEQSNPKDYYL